MGHGILCQGNLDPGGLRDLDDRSFDHIITDPPYSERVHKRLGREGRNDGRGPRDPLEFSHITHAQAVEQAVEYCRIAKRWILIFCDELSFGLWAESIEMAGGQYVRKGTWVKDKPMPQMSGDRPATGTEEICICHAPREKGRMKWNGGGRPAVYKFNPQDFERFHPAQKPLPLMEALLRDFTNRGDRILDPYAGSGSTVVAAKRLGRHAMGYERDPAYANAARLRVAGTREQGELF